MRVNFWISPMICLVAALMLVTTTGCGWLGLGGGIKEDPDDIALFVNGAPITNGEVADMKLAIIAHAPEDIPKEEIALMTPRIEQEARENLIREALLDQAVELEGTEPQPARVDEELRTLDEYLKAHGSSLEQLIRGRETTAEAVREEVSRRLGRDLLVDKLMGYRPPTEAEARTYFTQNRMIYNWPESVRLSQILITYSDGFLPGLDKNKSQRTKAEMIRERLLAGVDFAAVAREASEDPSAENGGDLGWVIQGSRLPPEVIEAAFAQSVGQISPVITSIQGFHILRVTERRQAHEASYEEVREIVAHDYQQAWRARMMPELITRLREQARVVEPSALSALNE